MTIAVSMGCWTMPFARLVLMLGYHTRQSDAASRRLAMPMFEVPFERSSEWKTSFGVERLRDLARIIHEASAASADTRL